MDDKDNKVVNTEEQNRAVNPGSGDFQETSPMESVGNNQGTTGTTEEPETGTKDKPEKNTRAED